MDNPNNQLDTTNSGASTDDVDINSEAGKIKIEAVNNAATFAMRGKKTHKDIDEGISSESSEYDWWENQGTYESNSWSVAYWRFADNTWKLQATRVELKSDGRSQMTSYSMVPTAIRISPVFRSTRNWLTTATIRLKSKTSYI